MKINRKHPLAAQLDEDLATLTPRDVSHLVGQTEDEALDWAIQNNVELDVDNAETTYAHLIGTVLSAAMGDDDHVDLVIGTSIAVADLLEDDAFNEPQLVPPLDDELAGVAPHSDPLVDDFFADVARDNDHIADQSWLAEATPPDAFAEAPVADDEPTLVAAVPQTKDPRRRRLVVIMAITSVLSIAVLIFAAPGSKSGKTPATAAAATTTVVSPSAATSAPVAPSKAATKPKSVKKAHKRAKQRAKRHNKRRSAPAPRSTPQAAPRPTVTPQYQPAPSTGGGCHSRSAEFSIEC